MSNYSAKTFHPITKTLEDADWLDDHFGHHQYGVRFAGGDIFKAHRCEQVGPIAAARIAELEARLK